MQNNFANRNQPHSIALLDEKCRKIAGRAGVIAALFVFIATYMFGLFKFGLATTIVLGWLPCGILAWGTAVLVAMLGVPLAHYVITTWRQLPLSAHFGGSA